MTTQIKNFSTHDLDTLLKNQSWEEVKSDLLLLTDKQVEYCVQSLQSCPSNKWIHFIQILDRQNQLEAVGKTVTVHQFLELLTAFSKNQINVLKLQPILVGLPFAIFFKSLFSISKFNLEALKQEGLLEPLEHHLSLFLYEIENFLNEYEKRSEEMIKEIQDLPREDLGFEDLAYFESKISVLKKDFQTLLTVIDHALAIVWNTGRIDLIEKMSHLKEKAVTQYSYMAGKKAHELGIENQLETYLGLVYSNHLNELHDDEAAIEALSKLSLWYLSDYVEMGLLQDIKDVNLNLNGSTDRVQKKLSDFQDHYNQVNKKLKQLGLETLKDLKNKRIYSKKMLQEYVRQHNKE